MARRLFAGLILIVGITILVFTSGRDSEAPTTTSTAADTVAAATPTTIPVLAAEPENLGPRRDLVGLDGWLNTDITSLDELAGKVVLVEMWTFGCRNCKARIPHNQDLYAAHSREDFEIVGVHAPEFDYEADTGNIEVALIDLGVTWPVALDTEKKNFRSWQPGGRRFWPRTFLIDQNGDIRFDHIGEGKYEELSQTIDWLLANPPT